MLCEHPAAALRILGHDQVGARESQRLLLDLTFKSSPLVFASLRFKAVKIFFVSAGQTQSDCESHIVRGFMETKREDCE